MRLAVLGMERMRHALAERLLAGGHAITVWNRTPHKANDLVAKGVRSAATPAEAAQVAEVTFMSLPAAIPKRQQYRLPKEEAAGEVTKALVEVPDEPPRE